MAVAVLLLCISLGAASANPLMRRVSTHGGTKVSLATRQEGTYSLALTECATCSGDLLPVTTAEECNEAHAELKLESEVSGNYKGTETLAGHVPGCLANLNNNNKKIVYFNLGNCADEDAGCVQDCGYAICKKTTTPVCTLDPTQMQGQNDGPMPTPVQMASTSGLGSTIACLPAPRGGGGYGRNGGRESSCPCGGCKCTWLDACFKAHVEKANWVAKAACSKALGTAEERKAASADETLCCKNTVQPCLDWQPICSELLQTNAKTEEDALVLENGGGFVEDATRAILMQRMTLQTTTSGGDGSSDLANINKSVASAFESKSRSKTSLDNTLEDKCAAR